VLLDNQDVLAWARGQVLQPTAQTTPKLQSNPGGAPGRKNARRVDEEARAPKLGRQQRFDLSAEAMRERRNSKTDSLS
jgi:hypothetical protein